MARREAGILLRHFLGRNKDNQVKPGSVSKPGFEHNGKQDFHQPHREVCTVPRTNFWKKILLYTDNHPEDSECNVLHNIGGVNLDNMAM